MTPRRLTKFLIVDAARRGRARRRSPRITNPARSLKASVRRRRTAYPSRVSDHTRPRPLDSCSKPGPYRAAAAAIGRPWQETRRAEPAKQPYAPKQRIGRSAEQDRSWQRGNLHDRLRKARYQKPSAIPRPGARLRQAHRAGSQGVGLIARAAISRGGRRRRCRQRQRARNCQTGGRVRRGVGRPGGSLGRDRTDRQDRAPPPFAA